MSTTGQQVGGGGGALIGGGAAALILASNPVTLPIAIGLTVSLVSAGSSIGLAIGTFADPPKAELDKLRPDRDKLSFNTSQRNIPVPLIYGTARHAGNLVAITDLRTIERKVGVIITGSGKSRTKQPQFELQYQAAFIVAICEGPIRSVEVAYRDDENVEDLRDTYWSIQRGKKAEFLPEVYADGDISNPIPHNNTAKFLFDGPLGRVNRIPDYDFIVRGIDTRRYKSWPYSTDKINVIENGDFEETGATALSPVPKWTASGDVELSQNYLVSGTKSVRLNTETIAVSPASISQDIALQRGRTYRIRLWTYTTTNSSGLKIFLGEIPEENTDGRYYWNPDTNLWEPVEGSHLTFAPFFSIPASTSGWSVVEKFFAVTERSGLLSTAPSDETTEFGGSINALIEIAQDEDAVSTAATHTTYVGKVDIQEVTEERSQFRKNDLAEDVAIFTEFSFPGTGTEQPNSRTVWKSPSFVDSDVIQLDPDNYDVIRLRVSGIANGAPLLVALYDVTAGDYVYKEDGSILYASLTATTAVTSNQSETDNVKRYLRSGRRTYSYRTLIGGSGTSTPFHVLREFSLVCGYQSRGLQRRSICIPFQAGICFNSSSATPIEIGNRWKYVVNDWLPSANWGVTFYAAAGITGSVSGTVSIKLYEGQTSPSLIGTLTFSGAEEVKSLTWSLPNTDKVYYWSIEVSGGAEMNVGSVWFEMESTDRPTTFTLYQRLGAQYEFTTGTTSESNPYYYYRSLDNYDIENVSSSSRVFSVTQHNATLGTNGCAVNLRNTISGPSLISAEILTLNSGPTYDSTPILTFPTDITGMAATFRSNSGSGQTLRIPSCYIETRIEVAAPGEFEPLNLDDTQFFLNRLFEDTGGTTSDFDDWVEVTAGSGTVTSEESDNYQGTRSVRLEVTSSASDAAYVSQTITVSRARRYRVMGWVKKSSGTRDLKIQLQSSSLYFIGSGIENETESSWQASSADNWNEVINEPIFATDWEQGEDFASGGGTTKGYWAPFVFYFHTFDASLDETPSIGIDIGLDGGLTSAGVVLLDKVECVEVDESFRKVGEVTIDYAPGRPGMDHVNNAYYTLLPASAGFATGGLVRYPREKGDVSIQMPPEGWVEETPTTGGYYPPLDIVFFLSPVSGTDPQQAVYGKWGTRRDDTRTWVSVDLGEDYNSNQECWFFDPVKGYFYSLSKDGSTSLPYIYRLQIDGNNPPNEESFDLTEIIEMTWSTNDEFLEIYVDPEQDIIYLLSVDSTTNQVPSYTVHRLKFNDQYFGDQILLESQEAETTFSSENYYSLTTDRATFDGSVSSYGYDPEDESYWNEHQVAWFDPDDYDEIYLEVHYTLDELNGQSPNLAAEVAVFDIQSSSIIVGTETALIQTGTTPTLLDRNQNVVRSGNIRNLFDSKNGNKAEYTFDAIVTNGSSGDKLQVTGCFLVCRQVSSDLPATGFRTTYAMGGGHENLPSSGGGAGLSGITLANRRPMGGGWRYVASDWPDNVTFEFWAVFASNYSGTGSATPTLVLVNEGDPGGTPTNVVVSSQAGNVGGSDPFDRRPLGGSLSVSKGSLVDGKVYRLYWHDSGGSIPITPCGCGMEAVWSETPTVFPAYFPLGTGGWFTPWNLVGGGNPTPTEEFHFYRDARYPGSYPIGWTATYSRRSDGAAASALRVITQRTAGFFNGQTTYPASEYIYVLFTDNLTTTTFYDENDDTSGVNPITPDREQYAWEVYYNIATGVDNGYHAIDVNMLKVVRQVSPIFNLKRVTGDFYGPPKGLGASGDIVYTIDTGKRALYGFSFEADDPYFTQDSMAPGDSRERLVIGSSDYVSFDHLTQRFLVVSNTSGYWFEELWDRSDGTDLRPNWLKKSGTLDNSAFVGQWAVNSNNVRFTLSSGTSGRSALYHQNPTKTDSQEVIIKTSSFTVTGGGELGAFLRLDPSEFTGYFVGLESNNVLNAYRIPGLTDAAVAISGTPTGVSISSGDTIHVRIETIYDQSLNRDTVEINVFQNSGTTPIATFFDTTTSAIFEQYSWGIGVNEVTTAVTGTFEYDFDTIQVKDFGTPQTENWSLVSFHPNGGYNWSYVTATEKLDVRFEEEGSVAGPIYDFLTNTRYGVGLPERFINPESFESVSAYCTGLVKSAATTFEERFQLNYVIDRASSVLNILNAMTSSFGGSVLWRDGKVDLIVERPLYRIAKQWDESDFIQGTFGFSMASQKDTPNYVRVEFFNEFDDYRRDYAPAEDEHDQEVTGEIRQASILAEALTRPSQALRLSKQILDSAATNKIVATFSVDFSNLGIQVGDIVEISHDLPGWVKKLFRILEFSETQEDQFNVTAVEFTPGLFQDVAQDLQLADLGTGPTRLFSEVLSPARTVIWDQAPSDTYWFLFARDQSSAPVSTFAIFRKEPYPDGIIYDNFIDGTNTVVGARIRRSEGVVDGTRLRSNEREEMQITTAIGEFDIPTNGGRIVVSALPSVNYAERSWFLAQDQNTFGPLIPEFNFFDDAAQSGSGGGRTTEAMNYTSYDTSTRKFSTIRRGVDGSVQGDDRRAEAAETLYGGNRQINILIGKYAPSLITSANKEISYYGSGVINRTGSPIVSSGTSILKEDEETFIVGGNRLFDGIAILVTTPLDDNQPDLDYKVEYSSSANPSGSTSITSGPLNGESVVDTIQGANGDSSSDTIEWKELPGLTCTAPTFKKADVEADHSNIELIGASPPFSTGRWVILEWEVPTDWYKTNIYDSANDVFFPSAGADMKGRFMIRIRRISGPTQGGVNGGIGTAAVVPYDSYNVAIFPDEGTPINWNYGASGRGQVYDFKVVTVGVGGQQPDDEYVQVFPQTKVVL